MNTLNEEFDEAMLTFDLVAILYHDFDEFWGAPTILEPNNVCIPIVKVVLYGWMGM